MASVSSVSKETCQERRSRVGHSLLANQRRQPLCVALALKEASSTTMEVHEGVCTAERSTACGAIRFQSRKAMALLWPLSC